MNMEHYEQQLRMLEVYTKFAIAEEQIKENNVTSADTSIKELRAKYGL